MTRSLLLLPLLALTVPAWAGPGDLPDPKGKAKWECKGKVETLFLQAELNVRKEAFAEAEAQLRETLTERPGCGQAIVPLAQALEGQGRADEALEVLTWGAELFEDREDLRISASEIMIDAGRYRIAAETAQSAITLNPKSFLAVRRRVQALSALGETEEALNTLTTAQTQREGRDYDCLAMRVYAEAGQGEQLNESWEKCNLSEKGGLKSGNKMIKLAFDGDRKAAAKQAREGGLVNGARVLESAMARADGDHLAAMNLVKTLAEGKKAEWSFDVALNWGLSVHASGKTKAGLAALAPIFAEPSVQLLEAGGYPTRVAWFVPVAAWGGELSEAAGLLADDAETNGNADEAARYRALSERFVALPIVEKAEVEDAEEAVGDE